MSSRSPSASQNQKKLYHRVSIQKNKQLPLRVISSKVTPVLTFSLHWPSFCLCSVLRQEGTCCCLSRLFVCFWRWIASTVLFKLNRRKTFLTSCNFQQFNACCHRAYDEFSLDKAVPPFDSKRIPQTLESFLPTQISWDCWAIQCGT